jgi:hypothetical protein
MAIDELIATGIRPPQSPLESMGQAMQMRDMVQRRQINDEKLSQEKIQTHLAQQAQADDAATRQILASHTTQGPDGAPTLDTAGAVAALYQGGQYKAAQALKLQQIENQTKLLTNQKTQVEVNAKHAERIGSVAGAILSQKPEDRAAAYARGVTDLVAEGAIPTAQGNAMLQAGWTPDTETTLQQYQQGAMSSKEQHDAQIADINSKIKQNEEARAAALDPLTFQKTKLENQANALKLGGQALGAATNQEQWDKGLAMLPAEARTQYSPMFSPDGAAQARRLGMTAEQQASIDARLAEVAKLNTPAELAAQAANPNLPQGQRDAADAALKRLNEYQKAGRSVTNVAAPQLSPEGLAWLQQSVANGGAIPNLGRNAGGTIGQIINGAAGISNAAGTDRNSMIANLKANTQSLANFQKQRDQIVSFESAATKNIDLFLNAASKIPDSGMPWVNTPLRLLDEKMVGSANMAAVNAARAVATNEVAKVTGGGGMGGVLSDAARQEVKDYNPANATFAQTLAVVKILKQDMANRHKSMDETLDEVKGRIGGGGNTAPKKSDPLGIR